MNRDLLERLPEINRARGYRLYSRNGGKIIDFYQDSGQAVLGHRLSGISLAIKQAVDKGVLFSCRTRYDTRLENAVKKFAGKDVFFSVFTDLRKLFSSIKRDFPPFFQEKGSSSSDTVFWHPFSGDKLEDFLNKYKYVVPVIPFPGNLSPYIVLSRLTSLPVSELISPVTAAPFISVIYKLTDPEKKNMYDLWFAEDEVTGKLWRRKGIYLLPLYEKKLHERVFCSFLENGYLLSPVYETPSILPGEISKGERENFLKTVIKLSGEYL